MRYNKYTYRETEERKFDDFAESFNWMVDVVVLGRNNGYQERKVGRDEVGIVTIDTVRVPDRAWTYETAIMSGDECVIVEGCDDLEDAKEMHKEWIGLVHLMLKNPNTDAVALWDIADENEYEVKVR